MKKGLLYLVTTLALFISPLLTLANGGIVKPLPEGDWVWVNENAQQAFINYENGIEKLIIAVNIKKENSDIAWIIPVPSNPENVEVDIVSELPSFFGDEIVSKGKIQLSKNLIISGYLGILGQIWTLPLSFLLSSGPRGFSEEIISGELFSIETHLEKMGMIAEVISVKNAQAIYNYFSQKGFNIKQEIISELNSYIDKDYSFVVIWISPQQQNEEIEEERGIFIKFPSPKIYYPLILTSVYGETEVPIEIRILDHVKPEIFPEIKPYTKVSYFTKRTEGAGDTARCEAKVSEFRIILESYWIKHQRYPLSLKELTKDKELGDEARNLLDEINKYCISVPFYTSKGKDDFTMKVKTSVGVIFIDPHHFIMSTEKKEVTEFTSPQLEKFYGNKKPWKGEAEYTKVTIDAPAKLLKNDLWMEIGRPFKISFALWIAKNTFFSIAVLYLLLVGSLSFLSGGIAGLLCFRKFKKYALIGLSNLFTLVGLILVFNYVRKKKGEDLKYLKYDNFEFLFSIIFILSLAITFLIWLSLKEKTPLWSLPIILVKGGAIITILSGVLLLIRHFLLKIGIQNRVILAILVIIFSIIFWIAIGFLFLFFVLRF